MDRIDHSPTVRPEKLRILLDEERRRAPAPASRSSASAAAAATPSTAWCRPASATSSSSSPTPTSRRCTNNAAPIKVQIGAQLTKGLGAGADPERRPRGRARGHRQDSRGADRRRHGVRHDGPRRRHRHRRRAGHRQPRQSDRRADGRGRHQAVQVRGPQARDCRPSAACRSWPTRVDTMITIPNERLLTTVDESTSMSDGVRDRRRRAAAGDSGHLGSDPRARPHQPRLRRREDDHVAHGHGDHGHRHRHRRGPRARRRDRGHLEPAARGRLGRRARAA